MINPLPMLGMIFGGLAVGLGAGWAIWGQKEQIPGRVATLLHEHCEPYLSGTTAAQPVWFEEIPGLGRFAFGDPYTGLTIRYSSSDRSLLRQCEISDQLALWSDADRFEIYSSAATWAEEWVAPMHDGDLVFLDLTKTGVGDPKVIFRPAPTEGAYLMLITHKWETKSTHVTMGWSEFNQPVAVGEEA